MSLRGQYLDAMGITRWVRRELAPEAQIIEETPPAVESQETAQVAEARRSKPEPLAPQSVPASVESPRPSQIVLDVSNSGWEELRSVVSNCRKCGLAESRTQTVFGTGNQEADWLIIGEAPGEQEDRQGEPFVGRAGLLLNNMIKAVGFERDAVYIANVVKCRPPRNRDPSPEEVLACSSYLKRQIALIQPKLVLVVGRVAAQHLLNTTDAVGRMRGKLHTYPGTNTPLIVTYHPAYLLRRPIEKRKAWDDLKFALTTYRSRLEPA